MLDLIGHDPYADAGYPLRADLFVNGAILDQVTMVSMGKGVYVALPQGGGEAGAGRDFTGMEVRFVPGAVFTPGQIDTFIAHVTIPGTLIDEEILFTESDAAGDPTADSFTITGGTFVEEAMRPDWRGYQLSIGALTDISAGGPGVFAPFGIEFAGPPALRDRVELVTIETQNGSGRSYRLVEWHGRSMLCHGLYDNPSVFLALDGVLNQIKEGESSEVRNGAWNFTQGYGLGLLDAVKAAIVDGPVQIIQLGWHIHQNYDTLQMVTRFNNDGTIFTKKDHEKISAVGGLVAELAELTFFSQNESGILALLTGREERVNALGQKYRMALVVAVEMIDEAFDAFGQLDDFHRGRIIGRILGEASIVAASFAAGGAGVLSRVEAVPMIVRRLELVQEIAEEGAVLARIQSVEARTDLLRLAMGGACFVAGTPVLTDRGGVTVETLCAGDHVVSSDPDSGRIGFKTVVKTFVSHSDRLVRLGIGPNPERTITCTPRHPFVAIRAGVEMFVPAEELVPGDVLAAADASATTYVTDVQVERGPPPSDSDPRGWDGRAFTTYNIEVADWHTYFVGVGGDAAWVHNASSLEAEALFGLYLKARDAAGPSGHAVDELRRVIDNLMALEKLPDAETVARAAVKACRDLYEHLPRLPDGTVDYSKISYRYLYEALEGRLLSNGLETHHVIPKQWLREIYKITYPGRPLPADEVLTVWMNDSPGFTMPRTWHNRGQSALPNTSTVHDKIAEVMRRPQEGPQTVQRILQNIRTAYAEYRAPDGTPINEDLLRAMDAAEQWLASPRGIAGAP